VTTGRQVFALVFRAVLLLLALALVSVSSMLAAGRSTSAPAEPDVLAASACTLPCAFDLVPGQTVRADALNAVAQLAADSFSDLNDYMISFILHDSEQRVVIGLLFFDYADRDRLNGVRLSTFNPQARLWRLGDLLLTGGEPARVFRSCSGVQPRRMLFVFGESAEIVVEFPFADRITPQTPLALVDLAAAGLRTAEDARISFGCAVETGWHGFAPAWFYAQIG
jgi:hypothetical protein